MKYFFDESGSYNVKNPGPHIMVGISYPDVFEKRLHDFYDKFISSLLPDEFVNNEPKGQVLTIKSRDRLFDFLNDNSWLRIVVGLTDSEFNSEQQIRKYRKEQIELYEKQLLDPEFKSQPLALHEFQQKAIKDINIKGGLSDVQIIKGQLLMLSLNASLRGSLTYFTENVYDESWNDLYVCYDRQDIEITRMEKWVNREWLNWITNDNSKNPIEISPDWGIRNHPIIKKYKDENNNSLNLSEMFGKGIVFEDSKNSFQLQIVDWISNTVFKIIKKEIKIEFLAKIKHNMIKYNNSIFHVVRFDTTDCVALIIKYNELLNWLYNDQYKLNK
jgi:hypothetical protein